ncbi:hypothetical protein GYA49_04230 [Candidatus Beckwithbacteria bacterium]|nr:hypothetical protein [Candidatus Beckwithbacteria bacterium]
MFRTIENGSSFLRNPELVEEKPFVINIGDATLLASLRSVCEGHPTIIIDPAIDVATHILEELEGGQDVFGFLNNAKREQRDAYYSIWTSLKDPDKNKQIQNIYRNLWDKARDRLDLLYFLPITIKQASAQLDGFSSPVADRITYYYPSPGFDPRFWALELAARALKPNGVFLVATENYEVFQKFKSFGKPFIQKSEYVRRKPGDDYVSAYDIVWGTDGYYLVEIINKDGELPNYITKLRRNMFFRLKKILRMIQ